MPKYICLSVLLFSIFLLIVCVYRSPPAPTPPNNCALPKVVAHTKKHALMQPMENGNWEEEYLFDRFSDEQSAEAKETARSLYEGNQLNSAEVYLSEWLIKAIAGDYGLDIEPFQLLIATYIRQERLEECEHILGMIPDSYPLKEDVTAEISTAYFNSGYLEKARDVLQDYLASHPNRPFLRFSLADQLVAAGLLEEAKTQYMLALQSADNPYGYFRLGSLYLEMGETDLARQQFDKAVELSPEYAPDVTQVYRNLNQ